MSQGRPSTPPVMSQGRPSTPSVMSEGRPSTPLVMSQGKTLDPPLQLRVMASTACLKELVNTFTHDVEGFIVDVEQGYTEALDNRKHLLIHHTKLIDLAIQEIGASANQGVNGEIRSMLQVDGEFSCSDSEDDVSVASQTFKCVLCSKLFSTSSNLQKHVRISCKLRPVEPEPDKRRISVDSKTYHSDQNMQQYFDTCDNSYAKFMCCENDKYPITICNFWPCLFDFRDKSEFGTLAQDLSVHNCYEVLNSILTDAHNFYNVHEITFTRHAIVEKGGEVFDISNYRVPKFWQNTVKKNRPTFKVVVNGGLVTISFSDQYALLLHVPQYVTEVIENHENSDENKSSEIELSQQLSQVSLESSDTEFERPIKRARIHNRIPGWGDGRASHLHDRPAHPHVGPACPLVGVQHSQGVGSFVFGSGDALSISSAPVNSSAGSVTHPLPSVRRKTVTCSLCGAVLSGGQSALTRHQRNNCPGGQNKSEELTPRRRSKSRELPLLIADVLTPSGLPLPVQASSVDAPEVSVPPPAQDSQVMLHVRPPPSHDGPLRSHGKARKFQF